MSLPPLLIEYIITPEGGVFFGWSIHGREHIQHDVPIYHSRSADIVHELEQAGTLDEKIHDSAIAFFDGCLAEGTNIPRNYPYQFYRKGLDQFLYEGNLRKS